MMKEGEWPENVNGLAVPYGLPIDVLVETANGPAPARWPAFYAVGRLGTEPALQFIRGSAYHRDGDVRRTAVEVLGRLPRSEPNDLLLWRALRDSSGPVVRTACDIAGARRWEEARETLRDLARTSDMQTRIAAVQALAKIGNHADVDVAEALMTAGDLHARKEGAFASRSLASSDSWRRLADAWLSDAIPRHRLWAAQLFGEFGVKPDVLALQQLAADHDGHVREAARQAVEALRGRAG